jgi:hypothetical protein
LVTVGNIQGNIAGGDLAVGLERYLGVVVLFREV